VGILPNLIVRTGVISFKYYTESRLFFIAITVMEVRRWSCAHVEQMVHSTVLTEKGCTVQLFARRDSLIAIFGKRSCAKYRVLDLYIQVHTGLDIIT